jgi:hypothetical protein
MSRAEEALVAVRRIDAERSLIEAEIRGVLSTLGAAGMDGALVDGKITFHAVAFRK